MEVALGIETCDLSPAVLRHVIDLALVHGLVRERRSNREDLAFLAFNQHARQSVGTPLKEHVTTLHEPLLYELVAKLGGLARLAAASEEDATLLILHRHEVRRDFDVHYVRAVAVRSEVVHEKVVRIVDEEVKRVEHVPVVFQHGHLQSGLDRLAYLGLGLLAVVNELNTPLLVLLPKQVRRLLNEAFRCLELALELVHLGEEADVVSLVELGLFESEELFAAIGPLGDLLGALLDVDDVGVLDELVELVHLLLLHRLDLFPEAVEEVDQLSSNLSPQVEVLALKQRHLLGREDLTQAEVDVL